MADDSKQGGGMTDQSGRSAHRHAPMTNTRMFLTMLFGAVFRRRSRASMAVVASMVGAATLFCLAAVCLEVPRQMNQEMRAYGANLVVTPIQQAGQSRQGIEPGMVSHTTEMVTAKAPARHATYRYESVRVNAGSHMMAGIDAEQVRQLNHHWNVDGEWPKAGSVMVGRDLADALGLKPGSRITVSYRASDNADDAPVAGAAAGAEQSDAQQTADAQAESHSASGASSGGSGHMHGMAGMPDNSGQSNEQAQNLAQQGSQAPVDESIAKDAQESGMELRVGGIVDTGGSEDQIIYASLHDMEALTGAMPWGRICRQ